MESNDPINIKPTQNLTLNNQSAETGWSYRLCCSVLGTAAEYLRLVLFIDVLHLR